MGDGSDLGVRVRYSFESPILGSAGGPRKALSLLPDEDFFIINGDTLTNVDLRALAANHRETGALVTIAVTPNHWPDRYGGIIVDSTGRFHSVVPRGSSVRSYHVVGVQIAHPSAFASLPLDEPAESIGGVYRCARRAEPRGRSRVPLHRRLLGCRNARGLLRKPRDPSASERAACSLTWGWHRVIDPTARVTDSVLWDDVEIGAGATLERCIVADSVKIPAGARFQNCAIIQQEGELVVADMSEWIEDRRHYKRRALG